MQVHAIYPFMLKNALLHPQSTPQTYFLSKDQKISDWAQKKSRGSRMQLQRGVHKLFGIHKLSSSTVVCRVHDGAASDWEREEVRWLREEKRWLKEEERWLREEARWGSERKHLLEQALASQEEIEALKVEVAQLRSRVKDQKEKDETLSDLIVSLTSLLQSLNMATPLGIEPQAFSGQAQIPSSASTFTEISKAMGPISSELPIKSIEMVSSMSQPSILELKGMHITPSGSSKTKKRVLKRGAEGDDVKAMQEALAKLGFYSGDDDMEYSTFSSGTERAVRSWQAMIGESEDGIVTAELLLKLLEEEPLKKKTSSPPSQVNGTSRTSASTSNADAKDSASAVKTAGLANTATSTSSAGQKHITSNVNLSTSAGVDTGKITGTKIDSGSLKKPASTGIEAPQRRVYLLGENRWEEPDRLLSKNGPTATAAASKALGEQCFSCKGQGRMMCTECDGTGELNVEEQFLEWAEDGAKCPYCEGKGMTDCDVCAGKGVRASA